MEQITIYENNDPKQAKTFKGQNEITLLRKLEEYMLRNKPDVCLRFQVGLDPVLSLSYCEAYKDFEIRAFIDDDPECFDTYSEALTEFLKYAKDEIEIV
jgi:hypothetical protein